MDYRWRKLTGVVSESRRRAAYRKYVERFITKDDDKTVAALQLSPYAIGEEEFVAEIVEELQALRSGRATDADIVWPETTRPGVDSMEREVAKEFGVKVADLKKHARRAGPAKLVAAELGCRLCGLTQRATGQRYGNIRCAAVGYLRRRLRQVMDEDPGRCARIQKLERTLKALSQKP